jgi:hypothetical protein
MIVYGLSAETSLLGVCTFFPEPFCPRLRVLTIDQVGVSGGISRQSWIRRPPYLSTSELSCPKEWTPEMVSLLMVAILVVTLGGRGW